MPMKPRIKKYGRERNEILHYLVEENVSVENLANNMRKDKNLILYLVDELTKHELVESEQTKGIPTDIVVSLTHKGRVVINYAPFPETKLAILWDNIRNNHATILSILALLISALALYTRWNKDKVNESGSNSIKPAKIDLKISAKIEGVKADTVLLEDIIPVNSDSAKIDQSPSLP